MQISLFKIPKTVTIIYCSLKNLLILVNLNKKKLVLKSKTKLLLVKKNLIIITNILKNKNSFIQKFWFLYLNYLKLVINFFLKKNLIKIKLNIIGIGFKFFVSSLNNHNIIQIKAGFSHKTFYKLPKNITVLLLKPTIIVIIGHCYKTIFNIVTSIKNLRLPDPYKKKGIFYKNENIRIKQGKIC
nr:ribosomal protein L6 [Actinocyclus sp. mgcode 4]